ncbi:MAG: hypothetical protein JWR06_365 [Jatrophihabitans sp.]|jgi:hypothetical protein|nr:hypothetical protein [Jatrophihabitans sp.]MDT4899498.1 hypothetical protein [Pseudonocardiales bacterium]MCW2656172.1 hypothetical protein [Jatrophihabitans sp.]MDT4906246.1 hypothetical protein [Pseudonocardiales bacterium]MDT4930462.1 hypothetical protein [Pseudonocardiales bacterium]
MRIGAALVLIAIGAILKFAVTAKLSGVDLQVVGVILMIVGGVGLLVELFLMANRRRTTLVAQSPRTPYVEPIDRTY